MPQGLRYLTKRRMPNGGNMERGVTINTNRRGANIEAPPSTVPADVVGRTKGYIPYAKGVAEGVNEYGLSDYQTALEVLFNDPLEGLPSHKEFMRNIDRNQMIQHPEVQKRLADKLLSNNRRFRYGGKMRGQDGFDMIETPQDATRVDLGRKEKYLPARLNEEEVAIKILEDTYPYPYAELREINRIRKMVPGVKPYSRETLTNYRKKNTAVLPDELTSDTKFKYGGKMKGQGGLDMGLKLFDESAFANKFTDNPFNTDKFGSFDPVAISAAASPNNFNMQVPDESGGGGFINFLGENADYIQSLGSTAANLITASKQPTTQTPVLGRHKRTPYKSVLPAMERANAANLSAMFDSIESTGGGNLAKQTAFSGTLDANTKAALVDMQGRMKHQQAGDRLEAGVSVQNAQAQNRVNALNMSRRRERLVDMSQAIQAGTQDFLNIGANKQLRNMESKGLVLDALKSGDTGVIERVAESIGLTVEELLRTLGDPNETFN